MLDEVGNFNGDGTPDLAVGTSSGLDVLQGNGDGTFRLTRSFNFCRRSRVRRTSPER
jgi:hypothetical protein